MKHGAGLKMWMAVALLTGPAALAQDDPGRGVARISVINGDVSVRRGDSGDWVAAAVNAPLVVQDTIAAGAGSRAEVQLDSANLLRLGSNAEVRFTELEYRRYQMQVARGTVEFRVLRDSDADVDVSTPAVSVRPSKKGSYRITVREDGQTEVTARSGEVEIYTPRGVEYVHSGKTMLVRNESSGPEFQITNAVEYDEFDRWNDQRDQVLMRSASYRYVDRSVYGADDLDGYGRWVYDPAYGWVWAPSVAPDWAPYRYGRWSWVDWYGWSWVSYDPWGWAPFHYGRWYYGHAGWCWYPGPMHHRAYWSPGLVAFVGFGGGHVGVGFGFGRVGWVPLGPHEPYYPWYGRGYYRGGYVDRSVHITNVNITNVYRNARVNNGISGIEAGHFGRGDGRISAFSGNDLRQASVVRGQLPLGPSRESVRFSDRQVRNVPQTNDNQRFFSRRQPSQVERVPFSDQQRRFGTAVAERSPNPGGSQVGRPTDRTQGWRRMEESRGGSAPVTNTPSSPQRVENGWRRFGEPSNGGTQRMETRRDGAGSETRWQRTPESGRQPQGNTSAPRQENRGGQAGDQGRWQRFGTPGQGSRMESTPRTDRNMQIAPPVVRERNTQRMESTPRTESAPRMESPRRMESSPRMESPRMSAPRVESAPRMSAPRSEAPRMSAPRSESRGGGGGGAPRSYGGGGGGGGSHSGGGGGGRSGGGGRGR